MQISSRTNLFKPYSGSKPDITADLDLSNSDDSDNNSEFENSPARAAENCPDYSNLQSDKRDLNSPYEPPASTSSQSDDDNDDFVSKPPNICTRPNVIVSPSDSNDSDDDGDFIVTSTCTSSRHSNREKKLTARWPWVKLVQLFVYKIPIVK